MSAVVDATAYLAPWPARRVRRPIRIRQTAHTYPLEASPEESWLPIAFRAFARISADSMVRDFLTIGTGTGLDALGAAEIFDLERLIVTDLGAEGLEVARANIEAHLRPDAGVAVAAHAGDLFGGVPAETRVDLIYENLPNIPASADHDLGLGTIAGRFFDAADLRVPAVYAEHMLALHHRCLIEARPYLRPGGGVLTALGGRIPDEVALGLHRDCGYVPELVAYDVKPQAEPRLVIPGYARAEEESGVRFRYYAAEAVGIVAAARATGLEGAELALAVAAELAGLTMTAGEAERRSAAGEPVAHSVLMILGRSRSARGPSRRRAPDPHAGPLH